MPLHVGQHLPRIVILLAGFFADVLNLVGLSAGARAQDVDVFLRLRIWILRVTDAEIPFQLDLLGELLIAGWNLRLGAKGDGAEHVGWVLLDKKPKQVLDARLLGRQLRGDRFAAFQTFTADYAGTDNGRPAEVRARRF